MNMQEIRKMAMDNGIRATRVTKAKLIHAIQINEGNFDCFASASGGACDQEQCLWRNDCFAAAKKLRN